MLMIAWVWIVFFYHILLFLSHTVFKVYISCQLTQNCTHCEHPRHLWTPIKIRWIGTKLLKRSIHIHHRFLFEFLLWLMFKNKGINKTNKKARKIKAFLIFSTFSRITLLPYGLKISHFVRLIQSWNKEYVLKISFRKIYNINLRLF